MFQHLSWPFPDSQFPRQLGAVVMRTVLSEGAPVRQVVHAPDGGWAIADGVGDPNEPAGCVATHIWHVVEKDPTIAGLATMPPGSQANRSGVGEEWSITDFDYEEE
jgi:hypothetical protein